MTTAGRQKGIGGGRSGYHGGHGTGRLRQSHTRVAPTGTNLTRLLLWVIVRSGRKDRCRPAGAGARRLQSDRRSKPSCWPKGPPSSSRSSCCLMTLSPPSWNDSNPSQAGERKYSLVYTAEGTGSVLWRRGRGMKPAGRNDIAPDGTRQRVVGQNWHVAGSSGLWIRKTQALPPRRRT